jgi:glucose-6-phosphate isomerase/transaldolase/glucose-6-phosphate isomerase
VLSRAFGTAPGHLKLHMLDSTAPGAVRNCEEQIDLERTLFIVASKSGGTIETISLYKHFWAKAAELRAKPGRNFISITDAGSGLERISREQGFRAVFLNPADIGGRYSALSLFGLVPAALIGMDIRRLLRSGQEMAQKCGPAAPVEENPGAALGAFMGAMARQGRDKLILSAATEIGDFGLWAEQLIAESTGKDGKGIIPVIATDEAVSPPHRDWAVVRLEFGQAAGNLPAEDRAVTFTRAIEDVYALGGEFYCWEMATAVAGALLGIHPFDQPNVAQAKRNTGEVLAGYERTGALPRADVDWQGNGMSLGGVGEAVRSLAEGLSAFVSRIEAERDYCAILAYLPPDGTWDPPLRALQQALARRTGAVVTLGYGPRYLHSTGQLHKGGADGGHFVVLTADDAEDIPVRGERYTFSVLKNAQSLGDIQALRAANRHVVHVHAGGDAAGALAYLCDAVGSA